MATTSTLAPTADVALISTPKSAAHFTAAQPADDLQVPAGTVLTADKAAVTGAGR